MLSKGERLVHQPRIAWAQPEVASGHFVPDDGQNLVSGGILAHELQLGFAVCGDEGDDVGVHAEAGSGGAEGIGADHVGILARQLLPGVFDDVVRLHGEAAEELTLPLICAQIFQNVLGALELDGELPVLLLHFGIGDGNGGVVRNGGGLDDDVHFGGADGDFGDATELAVRFLDDYIKVFKKRNMGLTILQKTVLQIVLMVGYLLTLFINDPTGSMFIPFVGMIETKIFFWVIGVAVIYCTTNAVNFTDGIDGLCGSVTVTAAVSFIVIGALRNCLGVSLLAAALAGGLVGYMYTNSNSKRFVKGINTGSVSYNDSAKITANAAYGGLVGSINHSSTSANYDIIGKH